MKKTHAEDLESVIAIERSSTVSAFVEAWSHEEHLAAIEDADFYHGLIAATPSRFIRGYFVLAGLRNSAHAVELKRVACAKTDTGMGQRALRLIISFVVDNWQPDLLWLDVFEDNDRARHVYQKLGFREQGNPRLVASPGHKERRLLVMALTPDD